MNGNAACGLCEGCGLLSKWKSSWPSDWAGGELPFPRGRGLLQRGHPTLSPLMSPAPRLSPKHRDDRRKTGSQRSSGSRSPSPSGGSGWGSPQQNGGSRQRSGAHGGRPGSAHSPPDVRTPCFADGSRARGLRRAGAGRVAAGPWGSECVTGRGRCTPPSGRFPPPMRPPSTGAARSAWLLRPPGLSVRVSPPHPCRLGPPLSLAN